MVFKDNVNEIPVMTYRTGWTSYIESPFKVFWLE